MSAVSSRNANRGAVRSFWCSLTVCEVQLQLEFVKAGEVKGPREVTVGLAESFRSRATSPEMRSYAFATSSCFDECHAHWDEFGITDLAGRIRQGLAAR